MKFAYTYLCVCVCVCVCVCMTVYLCKMYYLIFLSFTKFNIRPEAGNPESSILAWQWSESLGH